MHDGRIGVEPSAARDGQDADEIASDRYYMGFCKYPDTIREVRS